MIKIILLNTLLAYVEILWKEYMYVYINTCVHLKIIKTVLKKVKSQRRHTLLVSLEL